MRTITQRAQRVLDTIAAREAERQHLAELLVARIDEMTEQTQVIGELRAQITDLQGVRDRLQSFIDLPDWASLDGSISEGTVVRFGALTYTAKSTHTKALTRSPLNLIYWAVRTEGE